MTTYKIIFLCFLGLSVACNSQVNPEVQEIFSNLGENVIANDEAYNANIRIGACSYEVLINDMRVDYFFGRLNGTTSGSIPINPYILKTGWQTWTIRVYPEWKDRSYFDTNGISEGALVELQINKYKYKPNGDVETLYESEKFERKQPEGDYDAKFPDAGKPYVEYKGKFYAEVPYELEGWSNSQDLSKEDKDELFEELLIEYNTYRDLITNKELPEIARNIHKMKEERAIAKSNSNEELQEIITNFIDGWGHDMTMYPIEKVALKMYGNGKVIALERTDIMGHTPLIGSYLLEKDGEKYNKAVVISLHFHRPKGSSKLEVIR
ncbi:hypothetical protein AX016_0075 [Cellulophaga sp. RHA19]|uniref:hypothetical protein n=1 Tax=Cellulophaga sp. RHA19 TaxID=1798237 RepID=UPI000CB56839|nr:hypothetical protein [Cellulophaga sp. RHA19]PKB41921.1 hypothetical protein AX016_0075 [Cellulophaga sp. RHA19]